MAGHLKLITVLSALVCQVVYIAGFSGNEYYNDRYNMGYTSGKQHFIAFVQNFID